MENENSLQCSQEIATRPCPEPDQSSPHPQYRFVTLIFNIILPSTLKSTKRLFPSSFRTKTQSAPVPHMCHMPFQSHSTWFHNTSNIWRGVCYGSQSTPLCSFLQPPATSSLLGPRMFLTPITNTPSAYVCPSFWETKFHAH